MNTIQQFIVYSKSGAQCFEWNSSTLKKDPVPHLQFMGTPALRAGYSQDGKWVIVLKESEVILASSTTPQVYTIPRKGVTRYSFSPKGTYLVTWESPVPNEPKNLFVWKIPRIDVSDTKTSEVQPVYSMLRKSVDSWPLFSWTSDESLCARMTSDGIAICNGVFGESGDGSPAIISRIKASNAHRLAWSPNGTYLSVFSLPKTGMPGSVAIYDPHSKEGRPLSTRAFFRGDECRMMWNPDVSADSTEFLLALVNTDMDATGKSYYGESALYAVYPRVPMRNSQLTFKQEGNIHDIAWNPNGKSFAVIYGCKYIILFIVLTLIKY